MRRRRLSREFRIGVGAPPHADYDMADWVLSGFTDKEADEIKKAGQNALKAAEAIIRDSVDKAMSLYN